MAIIGDKVKIRLESYDHSALDQIAQKIKEVLKKEGAEVVGPVPLPTNKEIFTILRSPHKHKDSREQFEKRTHKRMIGAQLSPKSLNALSGITIPNSVSISLIIESKDEKRPTLNQAPNKSNKKKA